MDLTGSDSWTIPQWQQWARIKAPVGLDPFAAFACLCTSIGRTSRNLRYRDGCDKTDPQRLQDAINARQHAADAGIRILVSAAAFGLDLAEELARWYPDVCGDCQRPKCSGNCKDGTHTVRTDDVGQIKNIDRTPDVWQETLNTIYGERNRENGLVEVVRHWMEEYYEVSTELVYNDRAKCGHELAQTFAWWFAVITVAELGRASDLLRMGTYPT